MLLARRQDVRKCEERVEKLNEMRDKIADKLADPAMYDDENVVEATKWQKKYSEVMDGWTRRRALDESA